MKSSIKSFLLALALVAAPSVVSAQPAEQPHEDAVPAGEGGGEGHEAATPHGEGEHGEGAHHADPSTHFNYVDGIDLSYKSKDQYGGPLGDDALGPDKRPETAHEQEAPMSVPFVLVLVNFGIILVLLGWKAGPVAREMAAKRSDEIKTALDEAARLRQQAKDKLAEYSTKLKAAESEMDQMITAMRADAESERKRIIAAAEAQAAALKKDAELRIAAEIDRARHQLQREVTLAAADVAERVLREKTTPADQSKLVDAFLADVQNGAADARR